MPQHPLLPALARGAAALLLCLAASRAAGVERGEVAARLAALPATHPRLFLDARGEAGLRARLVSDAPLAALHRALIAAADRQLATRPVERVLIGKRLLDKSRTCLDRVTHLAYAWRMTGDQRYLERARAELLAVAAFSDWHPEHFLDTAEITTALGIGYDWLYNGLSAEDRAIIRAALIAKGITPALTLKQSWNTGTNNWSQVCHAGLAVGALAVHEAGDAQTLDALVHAVEDVRPVMAEYAPDGAYAEGPGYWGYGTAFNVVLISALDSALGTDFGMSGAPAFLRTADYYLHVTAPSGQFFNYSDSGTGSGVQPAMFWFAGQRKEPGLLWNELIRARDLVAPAPGSPPRGDDRLLPLAMAWAGELPTEPTAPTALSWSGGGATPVAMHRSAWRADATFVGLKGGSPSTSHAHMDVGSFIMEADGERWAVDPGMQSYQSLESQGIDLWNSRQGSARWKVFRLGPLSHNILTVDGQEQVVQGHATIIATHGQRTVIDAGPVYQGQLRAARRGVSLLADRSVVVQDEIVAVRACTVRWAMMTRATVGELAPGRGVLTQNGQRLVLRVLEPAGAVVRTWVSDPPPAAYDAANPGTVMVGFETRVEAGAALRLAVQLVPGDGGAPAGVTPLAEW